MILVPGYVEVSLINTLIFQILLICVLEAAYQYMSSNISNVSPMCFTVQFSTCYVVFQIKCQLYKMVNHFFIALSGHYYSF